MATLITPHFSLEEAACHDGTPYPADKIDDDDPQKRTWLITRLTPLYELHEIIRAAATDEIVRLNRAPARPDGFPIVIDSLYRDLAYDQRIYDRHVAAVGDDGDVSPASRSQHPEGRASDIQSWWLNPVAMYNLILKLYSDGKIPNLGGIGLYTNFVHIDIRPKVPANHLAIWGGSRLFNIA